MAPGLEADPGTFSCFVVDGTAAGLDWQEPWNGFGMRGNSSRPVKLNNVTVPAQNLLGQEGDELWYVFDVIAPYFLVAMSGTYLGIAGHPDITRLVEESDLPLLLGAILSDSNFGVSRRRFDFRRALIAARREVRRRGR